MAVEKRSTAGGLLFRAAVLLVLLLMTIGASALLPFVRLDLLSFALFTARH